MASKRKTDIIDLCSDGDENQPIGKVSSEKCASRPASTRNGRGIQGTRSEAKRPVSHSDAGLRAKVSIPRRPSKPAEQTRSSPVREIVQKPPKSIQQPRSSPGKQASRPITNGNRGGNLPAYRAKPRTSSVANPVVIDTDDDDEPEIVGVGKGERSASSLDAIDKPIEQNRKKRLREDEPDFSTTSPNAKRARYTGPDAKVVIPSTSEASVTASKADHGTNHERQENNIRGTSDAPRRTEDLGNRAAQLAIEKSQKVRLALHDSLPSARSKTEETPSRTQKSVIDEDLARKIAESPDLGVQARTVSSPVAKKTNRGSSTERKTGVAAPASASKVAKHPPKADRRSNVTKGTASSPKTSRRSSAAHVDRQQIPTADAERKPSPLEAAGQPQKEARAVGPEVEPEKRKHSGSSLPGGFKAVTSPLMGPPQPKPASSNRSAALDSGAAQNPQRLAQPSPVAMVSPKRTRHTDPVLPPGGGEVPTTDHVPASPLLATSSESNVTPAPSVTTATPIETATSRSTPSRRVASGVSIQLTPLQQVEQTLEKYASEMRADTAYATKVMLRRARLSVRPKTVSQVSAPRVNAVASSIFSKLPAMPLAAVTGNAKTPADSVRVNVETGIGKSSVKSHYLIKPTVCDTSEVEDVPGYTHYVSLKDNLLSPNVLHMNVWPYFGEEYVKQDTFGQLYHVDTADRERKLRRLLQAQRAEEYANSALEDLGITWSDVLHFLLDRNGVSTTNLNDSMKRAVGKAAMFRLEDFPSTTQDGDTWVYVLSYVSSTSDPANLGKAALLCDCFQSSFKFPLWHLARRSQVAKVAFYAHQRQPLSMPDRMCRVCFRFVCSVHGEYREEETDDADPGMETDTAVATDLVHPHNVNRRKRMSFLPPPDEQPALPIRPQWKRKGLTDPSVFAKVDARGPFYACHHPGQSCEAAGTGCTCMAQQIHCEKTCGCAADCGRRYQGCSCKTTAKGMVCFDDARCDCFQLGRECDPDLCGSCDVRGVLDPEHGHAIKVDGKCRNSDIQRGSAKLVLLGDSGVHGMGLYAGETIRADDFIGEYVGEVITTTEGERRGAVYEHQFLSYLFSVNKDQEVDATYYGNEMRFMNHRPKNAANVYPRVKLVNTVHRIALYGQRLIKPGEELFFDYGPQFPEKDLKGGAKNSKDPTAASAPHVRNRNLVSNFYDVEDTEDAAGNVIARKATSGRKPKVLKSEAATTSGKPKGGARQGAGRKPGIPNRPKAITSAPILPAPEDEDMEDAPASPGHRLSAYYTSDDKIVDAAAGADAKDDEDFDPDGLEDEVQEESGSEASVSDASGTEIEHTPKKRGRGRPRKKVR